MEINIKTLCSVGALLLCSESVSAATIEVSNYGERESKVIVRGEILGGEKLSFPNDPLTVVKSVIFENNKLKGLTPDIKNWLQQQKGVTVFSIQDNEFEKFPTEVLKWFPNLESIHFWGNSIKEDSPELLYYGNLRTIDGLSTACSYSRESLDMRRKEEIGLCNKKIRDVENLIREEEKELSVIQNKLDSLEKQRVDLKKSARSNRQKDFARKAINREKKAFSQKSEQTKGNITKLHEEKGVLKGILEKLGNAQKESLKMGKRENQYYKNLWK